MTHSTKTITAVIKENKILIQNLILATAITASFAFIGYFTSVFAIETVTTF